MIAVDDLDYQEHFSIFLEERTIRETAEFLDTLVLRERDFTNLNEPEVDSMYEENVPFFYVAQALNACGTGTYDPKTEVTCGDIWTLFKRKWDEDPRWFNPEIWSFMTYQDFELIFDFSFVRKVMYQKDLWWRWMMLKTVGRGMSSPLWEWTRENIYNLPGFEQDPLKKKANFLITCLRYRPERFLDFEPDPMIDYHIMRIFLRMGLLQIPEYTSEEVIENEYLIRFYCYYIMQALVGYSKYDPSTLDFFFWILGKTTCCYEELACEQDCLCPLSPVCGQITTRREPRIQTINY